MKPVSKRQARYLRAILSGKFQAVDIDDLNKSHNVKQGAGCIVLDDESRILLGTRLDNHEIATPGGHVDPGEDFRTAALRELHEEANLVAKDAEEVHHCEMQHNGSSWDSKTFVVKMFSGEVKSNGEMLDWKWYHVADIPWKKLTNYTRASLRRWTSSQLLKTGELKYQVAEELAKNIIRSGDAPSNTIYEMTHGDSMRLVGTGTFRLLRNITKDMSNEDFKKIHLDSYVLSIRKHVNDVYSGRIDDGHKTVHQFTNKSLPAVAAELMSVFEWYSPEDEHTFDMLMDEGVEDNEIHNGVSNLLDNYNKHNISNIYQEMETIRTEIRSGVATDVSEVEKRLMKLFDKLESSLVDAAGKHNSLAVEAGKAIDELESKLLRLQAKIEENKTQPSKPTVVQGFSQDRVDGCAVHENYYPYLPKPVIEISPQGSVKISFHKEWPVLDQENFLNDLKVRVLSKKNK